LVDNIGITNGPCFSPDGTIFYCNDSWIRQVYAFDYDPASGSASTRRLLAAFDDYMPSTEVPRPDGATVDEEGFVWVAAVYGGEIRRYSPEGVLERRIGFPLPKPTSVAFGGPALDVLYVTSMASRGSELDGTVDAGPLAGSVIAIRGLGVRGVPERRFAG
jgi:sugar lactone lactonase YvrE